MQYLFLHVHITYYFTFTGYVGPRRLFQKLVGIGEYFHRQNFLVYERVCVSKLIHLLISHDLP